MLFRILRKAQPPSLSRLIAIALIAAVAVSSAVTLALVEHFSQHHAERQAHGALTQIAWQMRDQLDRGMSQRYDEITALANAEAALARDNATALRSVIKRLQASFPYYAWIGMIDEDGGVLAASGGLLEGKNVKARPWFSAGLKAPFVGDVHPAVLLAKLLPAQAEPWRFVDVAAPVRDSTGNTVGVLGAHLSWSWARDLQRELIAPALRNYQAEVFIVARSGKVLLGPVGSEGQPIALPGFKPGLRIQQADLVQLWADGKMYATVIEPSQGKNRYPGLGWVVVVRQPESVAMAAFHALHQRLLLGGLITVGIGAVIALYISRRLAGPLASLTEAIEARFRGVHRPIPKLPGYREAFLLSAALRAQAEHEERHVDELRTANADLERRVAERTTEIADREAEMRAILEQTSEAFIRLDEYGQVVEWNQQATAILGWTRAEALGRVLADLVVPPEARSAHKEGMQHYIISGRHAILDQRVEVVALHKNGHRVDVELIVSAIHHQGKVTFNAFLHGIGERKQAQAKILETQNRLQTVADNIPALVSVLDNGLNYKFANDAYRQWYGVDPVALVGQNLTSILPPQVLELCKPHLETVLKGMRVRFEIPLKVRGQERFVSATYIPEFGPQGQVEGFHAVVFDITERRELELRLSQEAAHDVLTGLPNRRELVSRLLQAMARSDRLGQELALIFLDLNGFKGVNDSMGHHAGDQLLKQVAHRLQGQVRKGDSVFRLAGDEFVVLLEPIKDAPSTARAVADKIEAALRQTFDIDSVSVNISASVGISVYQPSAGTSAEEMLSRADAEMYRAKHLSKRSLSAAT